MSHPRSVRSLPLGSVPAGTQGPVAAWYGTTRVVAWAELDGEQRRFHAVALTDDGKPVVVKDLGAAPAELGLVSLAADPAGLWLLWSQLDTEGHSRIRAQFLNPAALAETAPLELGVSAEALLWLDSVSTPAGPLAFYATRRGDRADLRVAGLKSGGGMRWPARDLMTDIRAWQVAQTPEGAAVAVVTAQDATHQASVQLLRFNADGAAIGAPTVVSANAAAEFDLDLARVENHLILAWSERRRFDAQVMLAAVDAEGRLVTPPTPATGPVGEQALVRIVPPVAQGSSALLVWEELARPAPPGARVLSFATVDSLGHLAPERTYLQTAAITEEPEIAARVDGWTMLAVPPMPETESAPTLFVELDSRLSLKAARPLLVEDAEPALIWGLDCRRGCRALAATEQRPSMLHQLQLDSAPVVGTEPGARLRVHESKPLLTRLESVEEAEPLADLAVLGVGEQRIAGYVTYFDPELKPEKLAKPGPDGRSGPPLARVQLFGGGSESARPAPLTIRGWSFGGLALAPASKGPELLAAWMAPDGGAPQIFLSRIDAQGKRLGQRMLTRAKSERGDVAAAPVTDGWLVAWVDERDGDPELYAARVNSALERRGGEQRLTQAKGDAVGVMLWPRKDNVLVLWADGRNPEKIANSTLFARSLSPVDGHPLGAEWSLFESTGQVHATALAPQGEGAVLAWLESPAAVAGVPATVRCARLDAAGHLVGTPRTIATPMGSPQSIGLDCDAQRCRLAVTLDVEGTGRLGAVSFDSAGDQPLELRVALKGTGPADSVVAPVVVGRDVYFVDRPRKDRSRVLRATLNWE